MSLARVAIAVLLPALLVAACPSDDDAEGGGSGSADSEGGGSADTTAGDGLGCAADVESMFDTTSGATDPVQETWGAACSTDEDCVALLGMGAVCLTEAVIYELPLGYCSKPCVLPDSTTRVVPDDPMCDPAGGIDCIGNSLVFQYCAKACTDDQQCNRDGYMCRRMPMISQEGDPEYCLMPDCCDDLSCA
jgi:hypothetical protein